MRLHFLGTGGYHPNETRHTACLLLPELDLAFDAGSGFFRVGPLLQSSRLTVLLSHAHLDHIIGLSYFWNLRAHRPDLQVDVYAVPAAIRAIREHLFEPTLFPAPPPLEFHPLPAAGGWQLPGGIEMRHFPLQHPGGTLGYRLTAHGKSLAYVTDTTAVGTAQQLAEIRGVDLLVHECYFPDGQEPLAEATGHSCCGQVVRLARQAEVGRLALVHRHPLDPDDMQLGLARAQATFANVWLPADGEAVEI